jgi:hypothetical protein
MASEQRVVRSAERGWEQAQGRPWETPVLREINVEGATGAGKREAATETHGEFTFPPGGPS